VGSFLNGGVVFFSKWYDVSSEYKGSSHHNSFSFPDNHPLKTKALQLTRNNKTLHFQLSTFNNKSITMAGVRMAKGVPSKQMAQVIEKTGQGKFTPEKKEWFVQNHQKLTFTSRRLQGDPRPTTWPG
jgi:hypothetical protein